MTTPPLRPRRKRDLQLTVSGLEALPVELPPWELRLLEAALKQPHEAAEVDDVRTR